MKHCVSRYYYLPNFHHYPITEATGFLVLVVVKTGGDLGLYDYPRTRAILAKDGISDRISLWS